MIFLYLFGSIVRLIFIRVSINVGISVDFFLEDFPLTVGTT